ncbi:hypothetical protein [Pseudomonas frederiksbergensis]|uniref:Fumarylacetoacetate hydrolase n=1 Tax=Pseudomonas frederiksbergensis TaxID=104087 RepID=A0A423KK36_9PSED|nr:hypothetical protein [Pseudomonas frederiksbergensis]RON53638.1 hypothetical protein BK665_14640 [Pseudomonas frederiksbergensis]
MDRIIDAVDRHGVRWVGLVQGVGASATAWQVEGAESSQALAVRFMRSKQSWEHFKSGLSLTAVPVEALASMTFNVPLRPALDAVCMVSGFGYTHRSVNGLPMPERSSPDWYYKGNGKGLVGASRAIKSPCHASGAAIEIEYACVYLIDDCRNPRYIGYTLAVDFSDPVLRHTQPGLAGLSKLRNTALCHELVIAEPPRHTAVRSSIVRRGEIVRDKQSLLGLDQLMFTKRELEALLFQHEELCEPGTVHYVLLGASLSTDKDAFELQHGDVIRVSSQEDGLQLSNLFEDEVVRQSCNC